MDTNVVNVGLKYGYGAANVSVGWTYSMYDENDLDDSHLFVVPGDAGILPGVMSKADVGICRGSECPRRHDRRAGQHGGVVSVQLD